ncbi:MAG: hypothetical protein QOJ02_2934 [Acidobacteriota bacterium]|nr:hypothetical protein [Acidobacteriota bacterium]
MTLHSPPTYTALFPLELESPGQVAQLVERGPEKAGVGGSIPSLATINSKLKMQKAKLKPSVLNVAFCIFNFSFLHLCQ